MDKNDEKTISMAQFCKAMTNAFNELGVGGIWTLGDDGCNQLVVYTDLKILDKDTLRPFREGE